MLFGQRMLITVQIGKPTEAMWLWFWVKWNSFDLILTHCLFNSILDEYDSVSVLDAKLNMDIIREMNKTPSKPCINMVPARGRQIIYMMLTSCTLAAELQSLTCKAVQRYTWFWLLTATFACNCKKAPMYSWGVCTENKFSECQMAPGKWHKILCCWLSGQLPGGCGSLDPSQHNSNI